MILRRIALIAVLTSFAVPCPAQNVQEQNQPYNHHASPNPSVEELQKEANQSPGKKEGNNNSKKNLITNIFQFVREYNAEIVALSTLVMAVFTIGLFISTYLLWKSGEIHAERELRAYVLLTRGSIHHFEINRRMTAKIEIQNTGQTPAYDLNANFSFDVHSWPRAEFLFKESSSVFPSKYVLGPRVPIDLTLPLPTILTTENRNRLVKGEMGMFVFGTITYVDAFKKSRETHVRMAFIGEGQDPGNHVLLSPMDQGNTAT